MNDDPSSPAVALQPADDSLARRAALLLAMLVLLTCGAGVYLLYARGAFDATQQLVLIADDSEGVVVGMNLTFSGFPIGRVRRIELADDGNARIVIDVPRKDAHWLRTSSVFTLSRGLVGNTAIRAYSGILADPALADGAVRKVLTGDASSEIPRLVSAARELVQHVTALAAPDAALAATLARLQSVAGKLDGPGGALGVLTGDAGSAARLAALQDQGSALLARVDGMVARADGMVAFADVTLQRADQQLLGKMGLVPGAQATVSELGALLGEARGSLKKVDALIGEAQGVAQNARVASADLGLLRAEVDAALRKVEHLVNEINRKWPFARDAEIRLP